MAHRTNVASGLRTISALIGILGILCLRADLPNISQAQPPAPFNANVGRADWSQLGGSPARNNTPDGKNIPTEWDIETGKNIKWSAALGSQTYGNVVVANGKIFVGTNNLAGYLKRYPPKVDLGVLLCFRETDGEFLWQHSSEKLPTGRDHDWAYQGVCSAPVAEGDRLWFVTNRGEVVCLDAEGFRDGENDGPYVKEKPEKPGVPWKEQLEADVVWKFDMMQELGVRQHNMATCAPTIWGDVLFICTSNGVAQDQVNIPAPHAPSFMAMDKHTGKVLWTDNSPGKTFCTASGRVRPSASSMASRRCCSPAATVGCTAFGPTAGTKASPNCSGNSTGIPRIPYTAPAIGLLATSSLPSP